MSTATKSIQDMTDTEIENLTDNQILEFLNLRIADLQQINKSAEDELTRIKEQEENQKGGKENEEEIEIFIKEIDEWLDDQLSDALIELADDEENSATT